MIKIEDAITCGTIMCRYMTRDTALKMLTELKRVRGNKSYQLTIKAVADAVRDADVDGTPTR
jgi:hypothetical protein